MVKRYRPDVIISWPENKVEFVSCDDGEWVPYYVYAELEAQLAKARETLKRVADHAQIRQPMDEMLHDSH
ncbi:MAG: hypothetical protein WBA88_19495 [Pseudaminobacter sp.]